MGVDPVNARKRLKELELAGAATRESILIVTPSGMRKTETFRLVR